MHEATDPTFRSVAIGSRPEDQITKLTVRFAKRSALRTGYFNKLLDIVVVHRVNTDDPAKKVTLDQFGELLRLILAAKAR